MDCARPPAVRRARYLQLGVMAIARHQTERPFRLVVTGEAESWLPALAQLISPKYVQPHKVSGDDELISIVRARQADAAVLDDQVDWGLDVLRLLRTIRRLDAQLPVVVVTGHRDRRYLQSALELRAYSVVARPLALEQLLQQIHGMMIHLERTLRMGRPPRPTGRRRGP